MAADGLPLVDVLDNRVAAILEACTRCGKCVDVCPTPDITGTDTSDPEAVAGGILDILRSGQGPEIARRWAIECCGSGHCLSVCEHGINPRFMLTMARRRLAQNRSADERRDTGKVAFKSMSRAVKVISRLQLPPELMDKLSPSSHPDSDGAPDLIFYTGCNMLKTPHIGLICLDILDRLDVRYEVYGGPANCCGILQLRPGDTENAVRQAGRTAARFAETGASEVISWCPTCQIQFGETIRHDERRDVAPPFDIRMLPVYLAGRLDELRPMMTERVEKRVAMHEYPGSPGVMDSVKALLAAVPGLELVDLDMRQVGYQITSLAPVPEFRRAHVADTLRAAEAAGVTTLAGVYHADHRELAAHESQWSFEIINYMELIGESMGINRPDVFKRLKLMQDVDAVMAAAAPLIDEHGLNPEDVRDVIARDLIGEQHLPIDRALHPAPDTR